MLSSQRLHLAGQAFSPHLLKPTFSALQPALAGPGNFQGNLSIPVNSMSGSSQASAPLAPLSEPPPFQILPDIYQPRNKSDRYQLHMPGRTLCYIYQQSGGRTMRTQCRSQLAGCCMPASQVPLHSPKQTSVAIFSTAWIQLSAHALSLDSPHSSEVFLLKTYLFV